jgi:hypothetical protein
MSLDVGVQTRVKPNFKITPITPKFITAPKVARSELGTIHTFNDYS